MTLRPAVPDDLPAMLAVFTRAFADDPHTQLQIAWSGPAAMSAGMASALTSWVASPGATVLIVEDDETRAVIGWACWSSFGRERAELHPEDGKPPTSPIEALERLTRDDIRRAEHDVLANHGDTEVLVSIAVDPAFRSRGVGSMLIAWGTQRADTLGRWCWVHASEAGSYAFSRHGFVVRSELAIDLAPYAPPGDHRWLGTVRFRSMTRAPLRSNDESPRE